MPELPEVETTKASLTPLVGQSVQAVHIRQPKLREMMPTDLGSLVGFVLNNVIRRAKYLLLVFMHPTDHTKKTLLAHLGMSGSLQQHTDIAPRKHDHLLIEFDNGTTLHYHDPRRFGIIVWAYNDDFIDQKDSLADKYLSHLGVEPLDDAFNADYLHHRIHRTAKGISKPIKTLIMEQSVVVGVGNIYAVESLFLSGIHPATPANALSFEQIAVLVAHIKDILDKAIKQGGSTLRDFTVGAGKTGYFQQTLLVYGRENKPCTTCQTPLQNLKIGGRASVYCPQCQPLVND